MKKQLNNIDQRRGDFEAGIRKGISIALRANKAVTGVFRLPTEAAPLEVKVIPEISGLLESEKNKGFEDHLREQCHDHWETEDRKEVSNG